MPLNTPQRNLKQGRLPFTPVESKTQKKRKLCTEETTLKSSKVLRCEDGKKVPAIHKLSDVEQLKDISEDCKENLKETKSSSNKTELLENANIPTHNYNNDESNDSVQLLFEDKPKSKDSIKTPNSQGKKMTETSKSGKKKKISSKEKNAKVLRNEMNVKKLDKAKKVKTNEKKTRKEETNAKALSKETNVKASELVKNNRKRKRSKKQIQSNSIDKMFKNIECKPINKKLKRKLSTKDAKANSSDDDACVEIECEDLVNAGDQKASTSVKNVNKDLSNSDEPSSVSKELPGSCESSNVEEDLPSSNESSIGNTVQLSSCNSSNIDEDLPSSKESSSVDKVLPSSKESPSVDKVLLSSSKSAQSTSSGFNELSSKCSKERSDNDSIEHGSQCNLDSSIPTSQDDECSIVEESEVSDGEKVKKLAQEKCKTPLAQRKLLKAKRRSITPRQLKKQEEMKKERNRLKLEKEKLKMEKEAERQKQKEERLKKKQEEQEAKEKEKEERRQKKEDEKQRKEEEKQRKDEEKQRKEEKREEERLRKEEEKQKKEEERIKKEEEKQKREEEKTLAEEEEKEKQKKLKEKFAQFFVAKKAENSSGQKDNENSPGKFILFQIKDNMRMAPLVRSGLSAERKGHLDSILEETSTVSQPLENYLQQIKKESYLKGKSLRTFPVVEKDDDEDDCEILSEEDDEEIDGTDVLVSRASGQNKIKRKAKFLQFCENRRPAYYGTWSKPPKMVHGRRPFEREEVFDYDYDSDDDWEEIENGESLSDSDGEGDDGGEEEGNNYEVDNDFFVPHGYLSDGEGEEDEEDDLKESQKEQHKDEIAQKEKLKQKQEEFELEMKQKTKQLKPKVFGCVWLEDKNSHQAYEQLLKIMNSHRVIMMSGTCPVNVGAKDSQTQEGKNADEDDVEESTKKFVKSFPEKAVPDLIRLIHGNRYNRAFLAKEFSEYWKKQQTENKDDEAVNRFRPIAQRKIELKIQEIGQYGKFSEDGISFRFRTWYVSKDIRNLHGLNDLSLENSWSYTLTPKEWKIGIEKEEKAVELEDQQPQGVNAQTKPSFTGVNLITKFTKVLTDEEEKRKFHFKDSETASSSGFTKLPKTPISGNKVSKSFASCKTPGSGKTPGNEKTPSGCGKTPGSGKTPGNEKTPSGCAKTPGSAKTPSACGKTGSGKTPSGCGKTPGNGKTLGCGRSLITLLASGKSSPGGCKTPSDNAEGSPGTPKGSGKGVKKRVDLIKVTKGKTENKNPIAQLFKNIDKGKEISHENSAVESSEIEECITLD